MDSSSLEQKPRCYPLFFRTAVVNSWRSRSLPGTLASLAIVGIGAWVFYLAAPDHDDGVVLGVIATVLATIVVIVAVFLWHLARAPGQIVIDLQRELGEARALVAQLQEKPGFPEVVIKTGAPLLVSTEESKTFPGHNETLIAVQITATNAEMDRRAILGFTAHVTIPEPRFMIQKLSRTLEDHPNPRFLPDPVKVEPQDQVKGEVFFLWAHDMDFLFGRDKSQDDIIEFVMENLRVNATEHISKVSIDLELPGNWYRA